MIDISMRLPLVRSPCVSVARRGSAALVARRRNAYAQALFSLRATAARRSVCAITPKKPSLMYTWNVNGRKHDSHISKATGQPAQRSPFFFFRILAGTARAGRECKERPTRLRAEHFLCVPKFEREKRFRGKCFPDPVRVDLFPRAHNLGLLAEIFAEIGIHKSEVSQEKEKSFLCAFFFRLMDRK